MVLRPDLQSTLLGLETGQLYMTPSSFSPLRRWTERDDGIRSQATGDMCATFLAGNLVINSQVVLLTA